MKYQIQVRRPGTAQARWRPLGRGDVYTTSEEAQTVIDARPAQAPDDPRAPWEYHITEVPD